MDKIKATTLTILDDLSGQDQQLSHLSTWYSQGLLIIKMLALMQKEGTLRIYRQANGSKSNLPEWEINQWLIDLDNDCFDEQKLNGCFVELTQQGIEQVS